MAFHDWNHNGKKDMVDDYIEYQIYKDCMGEEDDRYSSSGRGVDFSTLIGIVLLIFGVLMIIGHLAG